MENIKFKTFEVDKVTQKEINQDGQKVYTFVFSTNDVDRDEEIILSTGIDFENYLSNPVVLVSHKKEKLPVGRTIKLWVESYENKTSLVGDIVFGNDIESKEVESKVENDILKAVSIGFIPMEWVYDEQRDVRTFTKIELVEVSLVSIPANPKALIRKEFETEETLNIDEIVNKLFDKLNSKVGASISRTNKQKLKDIYDLFETITLDITTAKESLLTLIGVIEDVEIINQIDIPKQLETEKDTNNVDITITNKHDLLKLIRG